jgi:hypothetical protein
MEPTSFLTQGERDDSFSRTQPSAPVNIGLPLASDQLTLYDYIVPEEKQAGGNKTHRGDGALLSEEVFKKECV